MDRKIILLGLILVAILTIGCVQQFPQEETLTEIQFINMDEELNCIDLQAKEFVIDSNEEYQELLDYKSSGSRCENFELPQIDFSQNTLLGKYAQGGGCSVDFVKKIYKDGSNKRIIYSIEIVEEGYCEMLIFSMTWVLIPKVPSGYSIEFEIK